jgi:hypothetical protein
MLECEEKTKMVWWFGGNRGAATILGKKRGRITKKYLV